MKKEEEILLILNDDCNKNDNNNLFLDKGHKESYMNYINENDYLKSFNFNINHDKIDFNDNNNRKSSRKVSVDEDFIYNTMNI